MTVALEGPCTADPSQKVSAVPGGFWKAPETRAIVQTVERTHGLRTHVKDVAAACQTGAVRVAPDGHASVRSHWTKPSSELTLPLIGTR